jgi:hypothetical protein
VFRALDTLEGLGLIERTHEGGNEWKPVHREDEPSPAIKQKVLW